MKNQAQAIYLRIRHYVFDYLAKTPGTVTRIPSSRELADRFSVSQPTVVRALQELIRNDYLEYRRGVGLFSKPERFRVENAHIWGFVFGDGRWAYLTREPLHVVSVVGEAFLARDSRNLLKLITMGESGREGFPELAMLSGLCWYDVPEYCFEDIHRLAAELPVVSLGRAIKGVDSFFCDYADINRQAGSWMLAHCCRNLVVFYSHDLQPAAFAGLQEVCSEAGIVFSEQDLFQDNFADIDRFRNRVKSGSMPDGIIFNCALSAFSELVSDFPELAKVRIASSPWWQGETRHFHGILFQPDFEETASRIVERLEDGHVGDTRLNHPIRLSWREC